MNLVERDGLCRMTGCFPGSLLLATLVPSPAIAQAPIASSNFVGFEDSFQERCVGRPLLVHVSPRRRVHEEQWSLQKGSDRTGQ
jgi:hypothetical protein